MHITGLGVAGFGPFGDPLIPEEDFHQDMVLEERAFQLRFNERVNLFVSPNGGGKTSLLRAIAHLYSLEGSPSYLWQDPCFGWLDFSDDWPHEVSPGAGLFWKPTPGGGVPLVYIPPNRLHIPPGRFHSDAPEPEEEMIATSWRPPWARSPTGDRNDIPPGPLPKGGRLFETTGGVFHGIVVEEAIMEVGRRLQNSEFEWVDHRRNSPSRGSSFRPSSDAMIEGLLGAVNYGYSCAREICSEVVGGDRPHPYQDTVNVLHRGGHYSVGDEVDEVDDFITTERITLPGMGIVTRDDPLGAPLYVGDLSSGTQSTLLWVWALALEMAYHYAFQEGWQEQPAILLVDEIENHLHPTWQRRVIPVLLERFPNLQIFATTHSPFVVAGLRAGQVHRLSRPYGAGPRSGVSVDTNEEDILGWTSDEICRKFLEVVDPTDAATAEAAEELRKLRNEGPRVDKKEEEQRQQRIQQLRQRVNRDLLEGGPRAAQRKAFEERFAEELERYRQSRNLNQENGQP